MNQLDVEAARGPLGPIFARKLLPNGIEMRKPATKVLIGIESSQLRMIDDWRRKQSDPPTRSAAIRRLLAQSLLAASAPQRTSTKAAAKASQMAGTEVDRLADASASTQEQAKRKRRLLSGPHEFRKYRKDRKDRPAPKKR